MVERVVTPERFAQGMTFDDYVSYTASPENLAREGFDLRRFGVVRPRLDWSAHLREHYAKASLSEEQTAMIRWLVGQPGGPAKLFVIAEEWSSDCRRDLPYLARLAEAGRLELRIFTRDGDTAVTGEPKADEGNGDLMLAFMNEKNGKRWASIPVAVFYTPDFVELYRYVEFPAIYRKDELIPQMRAPRAGETPDQTRTRAVDDIYALLDSPLFEMWGRSAIDEILSALHARLTLGK
jgi:Thioredoxin